MYRHYYLKTQKQRIQMLGLERASEQIQPLRRASNILFEYVPRARLTTGLQSKHLLNYE